MQKINLKRKKLKPQETILDTEKYMYDAPVEREYEESDNPNHIVVDYTKKPLCRDGVWSMWSAVVATLFFIVFMIMIYNSEGKPAMVVSAIGMCGVLWSAVALFFGIRGFTEKDRNYVPDFVGIALGAFQIIAWVITIIITSR